MKKILAILLTVCMVVCMIPAGAFADGQTDLTNAVITIKASQDDANGRDYCTNEEFSDSAFYSKNENVIIKVDQQKVDNNKCNILIQKLDGDKIQITVEGNGTDTTGTKITQFDVISEVFDSTNYFLSTASDRTVAIPGGTFTGSKITPTGVYLYKEVKNGESAPTITKVDSSLYKLDYSNNINAGVATITATGQGKATGTVTAVYSIGKADFSKVNITAENTTKTTVNDYDIKAMLGSYELKKGTDYTLSFSSGNQGDSNTVTETFEQGKTYTVKVTPKDGGNFTGEARQFSFKVYNGFTGTVEGMPTTAYTYDGTVKVPNLTVKKNNVAVKSGYTVTYYNEAGTKVTSPVDAGTYKVVVEGTGTTGNDELTGIWEGSFTIDPVTVQTSSSSSANYVYMDSIAEQKYTGVALKPAVTVYYKATSSSPAKVLTKDKDYTVTYTGNIAVGVGKATVQFKGNYKNLGTDLTKTFIISNGTLINSANVTVSGVNATYDYTGTAIKPTVYVTYKSGYTTKVLTQSTTTRTYDYRVDYSSNTYPGTATITITGQGEYTGTITKTFTIKYNLSNATVTTTPTSYTYDGYAKRPAVTVKIGTRVIPSSDYDVSYLNNTNVGTASAVVTAKKYGTSTGSTSAYFTISGKYGAITPEYAEYTQKTTKSNPFAIKIISNTTDGTGYTYTSSDTNVADVSANGTVTVNGCGKTVITVTTTGNKAYYPASTNVTVTVKPTKGIVSALRSTGRGKLVVNYRKESPNASYYEIRYGRAGDYTIKTVKNSTASIGKSTIKNLDSGKKYYVKVRGVKELADGTVLKGSWSNVKSFKVK